MDSLKSFIETEKEKLQAVISPEKRAEERRREIESVFRRLEADVLAQVAPANKKFFQDKQELKFEALIDADDLETFVLFLRDFRYVSRLSRQTQIECVLERFFPEENAYLPFGIEHDFVVTTDGEGIFLVNDAGENAVTIEDLARRVLSAIIVTAELETETPKQASNFSQLSAAEQKGTI